MWMANKSVGSNGVATTQHYVNTHLVFLYHTMIFTFTRALSPALREIRILCSQSGIQSTGTRSSLLLQKKPLRLIDFCSARQFIASKYPVIKKHNPDLPVLIREANGTPARVFARFGACTRAVASYSPYVLS
jgi:Mitochondrial ribosomal protein L51 / S25 / CI-B8 domain